MEIDPRWHRDSSISNCIRVYSSSIIRLCRLRQLCEANHSVVATEQQVLKDAGSHLIGCVLEKFTKEEIISMQAYFQWWIKLSLKIQLCSNTKNESIQESVMSMESIKFKDLMIFNGH
jgi:hypothetical protein